MVTRKTGTLRLGLRRGKTGVKTLMATDQTLDILREMLKTLKGLSVEIKDSRRHTATSHTFMLDTIRQISRMLHRMEADITKHITQPKELK